jgi:polyphosphate kinase 2 (PPK2 family)
MPKRRAHPRIDALDLSASLGRKEGLRRLEVAQERLLGMQLAISHGPAGRAASPPGVLVMFEGVDAAGKGGAIKRLVALLDPRHATVFGYAAPTEEELRHHYLWRFWRNLPPQGKIHVFDRSWYGRVLVERVEKLASRSAWKRAYREINDLERTLVDEGTVVVKCWLQIDPDEQERRFEARSNDPRKRWKLTDEDWRNRHRWDDYQDAAEEMIERTSTAEAPWTLVPANSKAYARVLVVDTVCNAIGEALAARGVEPEAL